MIPGLELGGHRKVEGFLGIERKKLLRVYVLYLLDYCLY